MAAQSLKLLIGTNGGVAMDQQMVYWLKTVAYLHSLDRLLMNTLATAVETCQYHYHM